jgi:hypothetical protein
LPGGKVAKGRSVVRTTHHIGEDFAEFLTGGKVAEGQIGRQDEPGTILAGEFLSLVNAEQLIFALASGHHGASVRLKLAALAGVPASFCSGNFPASPFSPADPRDGDDQEYSDPHRHRAPAPTCISHRAPAYRFRQVFGT